MNDNPFAGVEMKQADRMRKHIPGGGELAAELRAGATYTELAEKYGSSRQRISNRVSTSGYDFLGNNAATPSPTTTSGGTRFTFQPQEWTHAAACAEYMPGEDWWHPEGYGLAVRHQERAAKAVCAVCPVRLQCLAYALDMDVVTPYRSEGIWGGMTGPERDKLRKGGAA